MGKKTNRDKQKARHKGAVNVAAEREKVEKAVHQITKQADTEREKMTPVLPVQDTSSSMSSGIPNMFSGPFGQMLKQTCGDLIGADGTADLLSLYKSFSQN